MAIQARFIESQNGNVVARICVVALNMDTNEYDVIQTNLMDKDHQSVIETLDRIWPDWYDYDQYVNEL